MDTLFMAVLRGGAIANPVNHMGIVRRRDQRGVICEQCHADNVGLEASGGLVNGAKPARGRGGFDANFSQKRKVREGLPKR